MKVRITSNKGFKCYVDGIELHEYKQGDVVTHPWAAKKALETQSGVEVKPPKKKKSDEEVVGKAMRGAPENKEA